MTSKLNVHPSILVALIFSMSFLTQQHVAAQNKPAASKDYFTVENYYKVKWGYEDEFIDLWKKNHYPLLKKAIEKGDIISVIASKPRLHSGEDTRWDFRVTIVFRNAEMAFSPDLTQPYRKQLYPDLDKLEKDEHHRFELLIAHWDVMVNQVPVE